MNTMKRCIQALVRSGRINADLQGYVDGFTDKCFEIIRIRDTLTLLGADDETVDASMHFFMPKAYMLADEVRTLRERWRN